MGARRKCCVPYGEGFARTALVAKTWNELVSLSFPWFWIPYPYFIRAFPPGAAFLPVHLPSYILAFRLGHSRAHTDLS
jgi:hypothetical protein